jgi:hypothetical protein
MFPATHSNTVRFQFIFTQRQTGAWNEWEYHTLVIPKPQCPTEDYFRVHLNLGITHLDSPKLDDLLIQKNLFPEGMRIA